MIVLEYKKGDMFKNLNKEEIFLHANNSYGHWGSGIALLFRKYFPDAYQKHKESKNEIGTGYVLQDRGYQIGCLITSKGYGRFVDPPKVIVENTYNAVKSLLNTLDSKEITINSPKINSGLFRVPWQKTAKIINKVCEESDKNVKWIVWELE